MYDKRESGGGGCMIRESRVEESPAFKVEY